MMSTQPQPNMTPMAQPNMTPAPQPGAQSSFGQFMNSSTPSNNMAESEKMANDSDKEKKPKFSGDKLEQGAATMISGLKAAAAAAKGGLAAGGGGVKAKTSSQKAEKSGYSYSNDKIPAMLSEGEIVIPRDILQGKNPAEASAKFVAQVLARKKVRK